MKPTVLVAATALWFPTSRLSMSLADAGFIVEAVCPPHHPLSRTNAVRRTYTYRGLAPLMSLAHAIRACKPDLVVSGDDLSTRNLHHLHQREKNRGLKGAEICALIERSFGSPESFATVYERASFMRIAQEEGVRTPKSAAIKDLHELRRWTSEMGFPVVLKSDGSSGGQGVRIAGTMADAELAFRTLQAPPLLARAAKRAMLDRDRTLVWPSLLRRRHALNAQTFIDGREATSTIACWKGTVLAELHFEVIQKRYAAGPATVMRLIENPEMSSAVQKMAHRLNLSGVHGFDFMMERDTGRAYLIEINPRTTQVGHLTLGDGRDLPATLYSAVSGNPVRLAPKLTEKDVVSLFPQEWMRDPASPFLKSGYHDVPWQEPELICACVRHGQEWAARKVQDKGRVVAGAPKADSIGRTITSPNQAEIAREQGLAVRPDC